MWIDLYSASVVYRKDCKMLELSFLMSTKSILAPIFSYVQLCIYLMVWSGGAAIITS